MKKSSLSLILLGVISIILFQACKPSFPSDYIQPDDMENILYDYILASGINEQQNVSEADKYALKLSVLEKHHVTEQEFAISMEYYMRHTIELKQIYERLSNCFEVEANKIGVSDNGLANYVDLSETGDTANIWLKPRTIILSQYAPTNYESFHLKADTSFYKGDKIMLSYNSNFILQDGFRDALLVVSVKLSNDSVYTQTQSIVSDGYQMLMLDNSSDHTIKEINGFFLMPEATAQSSTNKLLVLSGISMIKMHQKTEHLVESVDSDSITKSEPIRTVGGEPITHKEGTTMMKLQKNSENAMSNSSNSSIK